jgi:TM2 domain-containing membrane protein YozV
MQGGYPPGPPQGPYGPFGQQPFQQQPPGYLPGYPPGGMQQQPYPGATPWGVHPTLGIPYSDKTKIAAGLLQIFVGTFGVGRFYTGHTGLAIGQLVACLVGVWILSWFTCGISAFVVFWPLIDGIVLMASDSKDAQGRLLR